MKFRPRSPSEKPRAMRLAACPPRDALPGDMTFNYLIINPESSNILLKRCPDGAFPGDQLLKVTDDPLSESSLIEINTKYNII